LVDYAVRRLQKTKEEEKEKEKTMTNYQGASQWV
jgi:hypothetical protein